MAVSSSGLRLVTMRTFSNADDKIEGRMLTITTRTLAAIEISLDDVRQKSKQDEEDIPEAGRDGERVPKFPYGCVHMNQNNVGTHGGTRETSVLEDPF